MKKLKNFNLPLKLAISITIMAVLFFRMDPHVISNMVEHFKAAAWGYAILFLMAQLLLLSLRWEILINVGKKHIGFVDALHINLTSQLANLVFITSVGGMLARIGLSVQQGASLFKTMIATVFDRLMTLGALVLLSAVFLPGLAKYVQGAVFSTLTGYLSLFIITLFVFMPLFLNLVVFRLPAMKKLRGKMRYGVRYLKIMMNNPILFGKTVLISIIAQLCFFVSVYGLISSSSNPVPFFELMTVLPMISLVAALPISIGGWGVREGAFVYGLGLLNVPMETAFIVSVQVGLVGMLMTVIAGLPSLLTTDLQNLKPSSLKQSLQRVRR